MTGRLAGKSALVTGGSSGIGLATASRLRAEGARVAIAARTGSDDCIQADVSKLDDIEQMFREAGRLDVLFINAGIGRFASLIDTTERMYDELFAINTKGAFFTLQAALPFLNDGASVIFNSIAPVNPSWRRAGTSAYTASKVALVAFAQVAAVELAPRRIRVNAVSPGPTLTPINEHAGAPADVIELRRTRIAEAIPMLRLCNADEVASVVAFLASSDASYITGQEIRIDGGMG